MRATTTEPVGTSHRHDRELHAKDCRGSRCARTHQRTVRGRRRNGVCDRGKSTGQSNGAIRCKGDRGALGDGGQSGDVGSHAGTTPHRGSRAARGHRTRERERSGTAVQPISGSGHDVGTRDAFHGRGHGYRSHVRSGIHQGTVGCGNGAPTERPSVRVVE